MTRFDDAYETPKWRTLWLMLGFAVLIAVGVVTVLQPELEDEATEESATSQDGAPEYDGTDKRPPQ